MHKLTLMAGMLAALAAPTAVVHASNTSNAIDVCQGSLPSFEGALRKRPLGINNEGSSSAFIGCSLRVDFSEYPSAVTGLFTNRGAAAAVVSCTLVDGIALPFPNAPPTYQPKTVTVQPGGFKLLAWNYVTDNASQNYRVPNLVCSLPPGLEINVLQLDTIASL